MGGKGGAPAAPDYSQLAQASVAAAQIDQQTSMAQLDWAKQQYADIAPYTKSYMQSMSDSMNQNMQNAQAQQQFYEQTYKPIESQFAQQAQDWASPARANQASAAAEADVNQAYSAQRSAALQSLEGYGIDPSQTRYGALDLGARISQAAATAAAGTQARQNVQQTGLALEGEAINIGRGYPGAVAQSYATAQGAGASGVTAGLNTSSTYGNLMGTPTQWAGLQAQNLAGAVNAQNTGYQNQLAQFNANAAIGMGQSQGIGSLVGGLGMASILAF